MVLNYKKQPLFTTGEFAARAGVTIRTVRYYDKIGLLKPSAHSDAGHRLYSNQDFARLQKILTLKFIGLSLDEISDIIKYDVSEEDFKKSLDIQKEIINKKIHHLVAVRNTIDETIENIQNENTLNWDRFINIIKIINIDKNWMEQYQNASNLRARIKIHELFSTNKYGWMEWYFDQMLIPEDSRILEVGCGDANFWLKNIDRIPSGWDITLTDFSQGMIKDAKKNLGNVSHRFKFKTADVQSIPFSDETFDVVLANHMLYHVPDIEKAFTEIYRVLKPSGHFFASTVGKNHMAEMRDILSGFDSDIITTKSWDATEKFQLENGMGQITEWFKNAELKRYNDSLLLTDTAPLVDYIFSMPGNAKEELTREKLEQLYKFIENEINKNSGIHITKDTGFFHGRKY
jgi:ubiquinone/menaquinone biosynthesis C-methylase UbiE/DNA-binding transcriptional MerR regulator